MGKRILKAAELVVIIGGVLAVMGLYGCTRTSLPTVACFTAEPTIGHAPLTVSFDASCSSSDAVSPPASGTFTYEWKFDDGNSTGATTGMTLEHTFVNAGTYEVQLALVDSKGVPVAGVTRTITVLPTE